MGMGVHEWDEFVNIEVLLCRCSRIGAGLNQSA
jgi:hypothetical protein